ncbi:MAG: flagellin lysine-N-methylase [Clostridia bacterium]|nr:flagellin lysine-N-methylase [Clostridia bacterium]
MIFRTPAYYNSFRCIADKCTDNCCIGWEIDIDSSTAEYYNSVGGEFGKRLRENISAENSFILKGERCPFLNERNLCDIITELGENHLCQICRDHPRYFEWYGNIKEGGIGLSCEEGARLILTSDAVSVVQSETDEPVEEIDEELFSYLSSARERIFLIIDDKELSLSEKLCAVLDFAENVQSAVDNFGIELDNSCACTVETGEGDAKGIVELLSDFEPIDESWTRELKLLQKNILAADGAKGIFNSKSEQEESYILNLCRYFIWRYFLKGIFDEEILSKVKLSLASLLVIKAMTDGRSDLNTWIEKSKLYSKEMEYSEENKELFFDYTYEKSCLSTAEIKGLLSLL